MATIALYAGKLNEMPGLLADVRKSVVDYQAEMSALRNQTLKINKSVCNLDDVISKIQTSTRTQEEKSTSLEVLQRNSEQFIEDVAYIDSEVADVVKQRKDDFYDRYYYLKPDDEKSWLEIRLDKAGEWCREHWKLLATVVIVAVAVALLWFGVGAILAGACWGAIFGAVIGGTAGGLESMSRGGTFLEGFEEGAYAGTKKGAAWGAFFAVLGGVGGIIGTGISGISKLGSFIKGTAVVTKVISLGMAGFDMLALLDMAVDSTANPIADFNKKLHANKLYNIFQISMAAIAVFTGGMSKTMYYPEGGRDSGATFASDEKLASHFDKHGEEFKGTFNSANEYLKGAQDVMKNGYEVEYMYKGEVRTGYVQFIGNSSKGSAKFAFVGTNSEGYITTFHTESGTSFWKMLNGENIPVINPK